MFLYCFCSFSTLRCLANKNNRKYWIYPADRGKIAGLIQCRRPPSCPMPIVCTMTTILSQFLFAERRPKSKASKKHKNSLILLLFSPIFHKIRLKSSLSQKCFYFTKIINCLHFSNRAIYSLFILIKKVTFLI